MADQYTDLYDALLDAFERDSMARMLRLKLSQRLDRISQAHDFQQVIHELLKKGESEGWLQDLANGAYAYHPDHPLLKRFMADYYPDLLPPQAPPTAVIDMMEMTRTDPASAAALVDNKRASGSYDVFLCHNTLDKPAVMQIGSRLMEWGILPWLDEWDLQPGVLWQDALEEQISNIASAAVFFGKQDQGPWQKMEVRALIEQAVKRRSSVIPVLLPDCPGDFILPNFLQQFHAVDFRITDPDPMTQLIWGVIGKRHGQGNVLSGPLPHCQARFLREDHSLVFVDREDCRDAVTDLSKSEGPKILVIDGHRPHCGKSHSWELIRFVTKHLTAHHAAYIDFKEESYSDPDQLMREIGRRLHVAPEHLERMPRKAAQEPRWIDELCNWLIEWVVGKEITAWVVLDSFRQVDNLTDDIGDLIQKLAYRTEYTEERLRLVLLAYEVKQFPIKTRQRVRSETIPEPVGKLELMQFFEHLFQSKSEIPDPDRIEEITDWVLVEIEQRADVPDERFYLLSPVIQEAELKLFQ